MNYYKTRKFAFELIRQLYQNGNSIKMIEYKIMTRFGFGSNFVKKSITLIDEMADDVLKNKEKAQKEVKNVL